MKTRFLVILIFVLAVLQVGLVFFITNVRLVKNVSIKFSEGVFEDIELEEKNFPTHSSYFSSKEYYDDAYLNLPPNESVLANTEKVYGGIIPHHLIVKNHLASFFTGLEKYEYETVVLIGPNHFDAGQSDIISSRSKWLTPYGEIAPDLELIDKLSNFGITEIDEKPFYREHSISGLVPFVKKSIPQAKIVPIILKVGLSEDRVIELVQEIYKNIDLEKTLVLASVDFSHYLPAQVADFHDRRSNGIIGSFDFERIYSTEIDSPPSIYTLLKYLELAEAQKSNLLYHTNSGYMDPSEPSTTHNFYYFTKGSVNTDNVSSMMSFGDMMLDRYIGEVIENKGLDYIFEKITHEENRFFRGLDIISANLEGAVTNNGEHYSPTLVNDFAFLPEVIKDLKDYNFNFFNLANNHFSDQGSVGVNETRENLDNLNLNYSGCIDKKVDIACSVKVIKVSDYNVGLVGLSMVYGQFDMKKAEEVVRETASSTDYIIVNIHWGQEYKHQFNQTQQNVAHKLIDAGVDVIIGHHPHIVQGIEVYDGKAIFYSLGNFIFDQYTPYFPKDNSESFALGLTLKNGKIQYDLFPLTFKKWQLELMGGEDKEIFLKELSGWSEIGNEIKVGLLSGILEI